MPKQAPMSSKQKHWLLYNLYTRRYFDFCMNLIQNFSDEQNISNEYSAYIKGLIQRMQGQLNESLSNFKECLQFNPLSLPALKQFGRTLYCLGNYEQAKAVYSEILRRYPNNWVASCQLGICLNKLNKSDQAEECFLKCIEIDGKRGKGYIQLGRHYISTNKGENALKVLKQATSVIGDEPNLLIEVGQLYLELQNFDKAFSCFGNALTYDPTNPRAILAAGSVIQQCGDCDVALNKYRTVAAVANDSPALWNNIGMAFFSKNKFVASISCLKRASYLQPFNWKILINLGLVHMYSKQYASAFCFLSAGIHGNPRCSQSYMLMAITLTHLLDNENAERAYKVALQLDDRNPLILLNYAIFCYKNDKTDKCNMLLSKINFSQVVNAMEEASDIKTKVNSLTELIKLNKNKNAKKEKLDNEINIPLPSVQTAYSASDTSFNDENIEMRFSAQINEHTSPKVQDNKPLQNSNTSLSFLANAEQEVNNS